MRILCILPSCIGDCIIVSGAVTELTRRHPNARFTIAAGPAAVNLFADWPGLETLIPMEKKPRGGHWLDLWKQVVASRWDVVMDARGSAIAYFVLAKNRYVYSRKPWFSDRHKTLETGSILGLDEPLLPNIYVSEQREEKAGRLVQGKGPILAIAPVASWIGKTWPLGEFVTLSKRLLRTPQLKGARIMTVGGPEDADVCQQLLDQVPEAEGIQLAGKTSILTTFACMKHAKLYVGNDSGPTHMAACSGAPTLALYGPTNDRRYGPAEDNARTVRTKHDFSWYMEQGAHLSDKETEWMRDLDVATVERAALEMLEG